MSAAKKELRSSKKDLKESQKLQKKMDSQPMEVPVSVQVDTVETDR